MLVLLTIAFLAGFGVVVFTAFHVGVGGKGGRVAQIFFWVTSVILLVTSWWTTTQIEYSLDENLRAIGWPIPGIILARDDANSPWLDYVGLNTALALPMNAVIFLVVPAVVFLGICYFDSRRIKWNGVPVESPSLDTE